MLHIIIMRPEITRLITFRVNKENWAAQPWQLEASSTQVAPRIDGLGGNPIFSNIATGRKKPCLSANKELCRLNLITRTQMKLNKELCDDDD